MYGCKIPESILELKIKASMHIKKNILEIKLKRHTIRQQPSGVWAVLQDFGNGRKIETIR